MLGTLSIGTHSSIISKELYSFSLSGTQDIGEQKKQQTSFGSLKYPWNVFCYLPLKNQKLFDDSFPKPGLEPYLNIGKSSYLSSNEEQVAILLYTNCIVAPVYSSRFTIVLFIIKRLHSGTGNRH